MADIRNIQIGKALGALKAEQTRATLLAAVEKSPEDPVALCKWAQVLHAEGDAAAAREVLAKARRCADGHHQAMAVCDTMFSLGFKKAAYDALPPLRDEESATETLVRIKIAREQKDEITVGACCERLVVVGGVPAGRWRQISGLALAAVKPGVAVKAYEKSLPKDGISPLEYGQLILLYIENDDLAGAERVLAGMPEAAKKHPDALASVAVCHRKRGNKAAAVAAYRSLLAHEPAHTAAWAGLSELAERADLPELVRLLSNLLENKEILENARAILMFALGRMQERLSNPRAAFEAYERANRGLGAVYEEQDRGYKPDAMEATRRTVTHWFSGTFKGRDDPVAEPGQPTPIFIVGMPRSGTSLLERMLAGLEGVAAGGENKALASLASGYIHAVKRGRIGAPAGRKTGEWAAMARRYWGETAKRAAYVTDKLPQNYRYLGWALNMFPGAPIIYIRRDPRDIGWSMYKRSFRKGFAYSCDQETLAHAIRECELYMDHWRAYAPGRIMTVHYEELVRAPERVTRDIAGFCGLDWSPACLSPEALDLPTFTISEQQVREPINEKGIGRWREYEAYLQPLIRKLEGYGLVGGSTA